MQKTVKKVEFELDGSEQIGNRISEESVSTSIIQLLKRMIEVDKKVFSLTTQKSSIKVRIKKKQTEIAVNYGKWTESIILEISFQTEDEFKEKLKKAWGNTKIEKAFESLLIDKTKKKGKDLYNT